MVMAGEKSRDFRALEKKAKDVIYQHYHESPLFSKLSLKDLLDSIPAAWLHHFRNRSSKYYGKLPYPYGKHTHPPCDLDTNPYKKSIVDHVVPIPAYVDGEACIHIMYVL